MTTTTTTTRTDTNGHTQTGAADEQINRMLHEGMPLTAHHEIVAVSAGTDRVELTAPWRAEFCGAGGMLHGGYLMALADAAGALLAFLNLPPNTNTTTIESKTNFVRPVSEGFVLATATPVHVGRATIVVQTDITNEREALVSRTLQTQAVR